MALGLRLRVHRSSPLPRSEQDRAARPMQIADSGLGLQDQVADISGLGVADTPVSRSRDRLGTLIQITFEVAKCCSEHLSSALSDPWSSTPTFLGTGTRSVRGMTLL